MRPATWSPFNNYFLFCHRLGDVHGHVGAWTACEELVGLLVQAVKQPSSHVWISKLEVSANPAHMTS